MREDWTAPIGAAVALALALAAAAAVLVDLKAHRGAPRPLPVPVRPSQVQPRPSGSDLDRAIAEDAPLPVILTTAPIAAAPTPPRTRIVSGPMEDILYGSGRPRIDPTMASEVLSLFAHKLDLTRDLALGDRVRLVVRERQDPGGASAGETLDYAEWRGAAGSVRFYRRAPGDGFAVEDFVDETGADIGRLFLRTPLAGARVTSGFGLRLHPLLQFTRLHAGVDFAAAPGTPILAAAGGVVEAARWAGGYGRMILLDHGGGSETRYAHLSAWAPAAQPGARVRQGQVIGWTGESGLAIGPHLHFEVRQDGRPIDPRLARLAAPPPLTAAQRLDFEARRQALDASLAGSGADPAMAAMEPRPPAG